MKTCLGFGIGCLALATAAFASTVNVNLSEEHQVIRGFGGMVHNSWQGGKGLSEADADLAYGTGDGKIGLTVLRIPVNESSSAFGNELQAAKYVQARGGIVYATPWKPPTSILNSNGQSIPADKYQAYTDHLNSFTKYMKDNGAPLYAISFQNEPDWCNSWTCMSADEIYNYTKNFAGQLRKNGTKVISAESFAYQKKIYDKVLNDANALKNWDILGAHFYASVATTGDDFFKYNLADQKNVERWMTEHYTESQGSGNYWRTVMVTGDQATASKVDTVRAMDVAYEIHRGLAVGNFSQYTWWYIRRCYGLIMETDFSNKLNIPANEVGKVSKRGYILSQFARFIRPGAIRVGATINPEKEVYASAYKSADGDSTIVVLVNRDYGNSKTVTVNVPNSSIEAFHVYTTSEAKNAKYEGEVAAKNGSVTITMESGAKNKDCIVTLIGVAPKIIIPQEPFKGAASAIPGKIEMEDFDVPGSGKGNDSYYDTDEENHGNSDYRNDTGVDLYKKATGIIVGYNQAGEWLEYTVDVKKDGDYTMFAAVASANNTSSFMVSVDGKAITDTIKVPQAKEGEENYDDYNKVQANVSLTAGKHILRFTVTSSWMDIDYLTFVEGKDATDPEPITDSTTETTINTQADTNSVQVFTNQLHFNESVTNYRIFDLNGNFVGSVKASNMQELKAQTIALTRRTGVYMARSAKGKTMQLRIK